MADIPWLTIIGLGEDGPTHQPIEQIVSLRAIPNLDMVRPADANETSYAWKTILERRNNPAGIALSRQNLPVFNRTDADATGVVYGAAKHTEKGAYVLAEAANGKPEVILIATGSEVQLAVAARLELEAAGIVGPFEGSKARSVNILDMNALEQFFNTEES